MATLEEILNPNKQDDPELVQPTEVSEPVEVNQPVDTVQEDLNKELTLDFLFKNTKLPQRKVTKLNTKDPSFINLDAHFKEFYNNRDLTKEDILADPKLVEVMRTALEARYRPAGLLKKGYRAATTAAGGDIGTSVTKGLNRDYRSMSSNDVFETYQNWMRSFAGYQTVTVANEATYGLTADDVTLGRLGAGYTLFNQMGNAYTGEGSYSEMADATWDYTRAAIHDPSNLFAFGLGRLATLGTTKAAGASFRALTMTAYKKMLEKQLAKGLAMPAASAAARKKLGRVALASSTIAPAVIDGGITMGSDVAYQMQLVRAGSQESYNKYQTAFAALGSMVIPAAVLGKEGFKAFRNSKIAGDMKGKFIQYIDLDKTLGNLDPASAMATIRARLDPKLGGIFEAVDANFGTVKGTTRPVDFKVWDEIKGESKGTLKQLGKTMDDNELVNQFFHRFFFGDPDQKLKGYFQVLDEAGFQVHPSMTDEYKISGIFGQAIGWLDKRTTGREVVTDDVVNRMVTEFEKQVGRPIGLGKTADELSAQFVSRASDAGTTLQISSLLTQLSKSNLNTADKLSAMGGRKVKGADDPKRLQFALSVYKRLLTSHFSTTGANLKGFTQLVSLNTLSDFATGSINFAQSGMYNAVSKVTINKNAKASAAERAEIYYNRGYGSFLGAIRRGFSTVSPDVEMAYAKKIFELNPAAKDKLFRDVSGDGGVNDSIGQFNLNPKNPVTRAIDGYTKGVQTITLVRVQDEITKTWAFGNNMNQAIMREYGVTPEAFFRGELKEGQISREAVHLLMGEKRFLNNVVEKAVYRTQRETAAVNWGRLEQDAGFGFRAIAKGIETATNKTPLGFVVPFGSFLNTTLATAGDLTGVNAMGYLMRKSMGRELDFVTREGAEVIGKTAVGVSTIGIATYGLSGTDTPSDEQVNTAAYRVKNGLSYDQKTYGDGSIESVKYDWPNSTIQLGAQILAHATRGEKGNLIKLDFDYVPKDLIKELGLQLGGQAVRDMESVTEQSIYAFFSEVYREATDKDYKGVTDAILGPFVARASQGLTRHVEPVNEFYKLFTDDQGLPDTKQAAYKFLSGVKYVDALFGRDLPKKATALRGLDQQQGISKLLMFRESREPNAAEMMFNGAGMPHWKATSFEGPPVVKNIMQSLVTPYYENAAVKYLKRNPGFFELDQLQKENIVNEMKQEVQGKVRALFEDGYMPQTLTMLRLLSSDSKKEKARVAMDFLGMTGSLEDILKEEDPVTTFNLINTLIQPDNYKSIVLGLSLN